MVFLRRSTAPFDVDRTQSTPSGYLRAPFQHLQCYFLTEKVIIYESRELQRPSRLRFKDLQSPLRLHTPPFGTKSALDFRLPHTVVIITLKETEFSSFACCELVLVLVLSIAASDCATV